jgi:hypothetical protein
MGKLCEIIKTVRRSFKKGTKQQAREKMRFDKEKCGIEIELENLAHRLQMTTQKIKGVLLAIDDLGGKSAIDEQLVIDFCKYWREKQSGRENPKYPNDVDFKNWYTKEQAKDRTDLCPYELCFGDGLLLVTDYRGDERIGPLCKCVSTDAQFMENCRRYKFEGNPFHMSYELAKWKEEQDDIRKYYTKPNLGNKLRVQDIHEKLSEAFQND